MKRIDLITEEFDTYREFFVRWDDVDGIALDAEGSTRHRHVVARILHVHKES